MDCVRTTVAGDRRVTLWCELRLYWVRVEVQAEGTWYDISLRADRRLTEEQAEEHYAQRVAEAQARAALS